MYDRRQLIVFAFVVLSLASALYITTATMNYLHFFAALPKFQNSFGIEKLTFANSSANKPSLNVLVNVTNPSDYSGFQLTEIQFYLYFYWSENSSITLFHPPENEPNATQMSQTSLAPNSADLVTLVLPLSSNQTSYLRMFNAKYPDAIVGDFNLRVDITTFLMTVTGSNPYYVTEYVPLTVNPSS